MQITNLWVPPLDAKGEVLAHQPAVSQGVFLVKHRECMTIHLFLFYFVWLVGLVFLFNFNTFMHYDAWHMSVFLHMSLSGPFYLHWRFFGALWASTYSHMITLFVWWPASLFELEPGNTSPSVQVLFYVILWWVGGLHHKFSHNPEQFQSYIECQIHSLIFVFLINRRLGLKE